MRKGKELKPHYQRTMGFKAYEVYQWLNKDGRLVPVALFFLTVAALDVMSKSCFAAGWGLNDDGTLEEADFSGGGKAFVSNLKMGMTLIQVLGSLAAGAGIVFRYLRYQNEESPERAQQFAVRGFMALFVINIVMTIIRFSTSAFNQ